MKQTTTTVPDVAVHPHGVRFPLLFSFIRLPFITVSAVAVAGIFAAAGTPFTFPASPLISALYLAPVNIACILLLRAVLHRRGRRIRDLIGFSTDRLGRDILWGLLWLMVLYLPFALASIGAMFLLYGGDALTSFEAVFMPAPESTPTMSLAVGLVIAIVVVLTFAPLNAPTEELVYRGYAQSGLRESTGSLWLAILVPALGFGIQHLFFAPTAAAMLVFGLAFFVWGVGSGLIYARQRRLWNTVRT